MHLLETYQLAIIALGALGFGVWLLVKGGDWTVDNAVIVAKKSGVSKMFIAATIIAFGTSAPELFTSVNANTSGFPGIAVGNVIGSNIANIAMVLAISAMIAPVLFDQTEVRIDTWVMLGATGAIVPAIYFGLLSRTFGMVMVLGLVAYVIFQYRASRLDTEEADGIDVEARSPWLMLTLGITTLVVGSEILVQGAVAGGFALGVPDAVIGVTLIAVGTSLPELTACVAAARKGQSDVIVGGIVGSNIFNILLVLGLSAAVKPLVIDPRFATFDMPVMLGTTIVFAAFLLFTNGIGRLVGCAMFVSYVVFTCLQYMP